MRSARRKKIDEETVELVRRAAACSSKSAVRKVRENNLPLTTVEDGRVITRYPDGRVVTKSAVEKPTMGLVKGMVLVFR